MSDPKRLSHRIRHLDNSLSRHQPAALNSPSPAEIESLFRLMLREMGPTGWWPADTIFEIMVGAVLVQNTAFTNVERSLACLKEAEAFSPDAIATMRSADLQGLIRPSGFYRNKARALQSLAQWYRQQFDCEPTNALGVPDEELRHELLGLFGIGGETADVLMLYVFDRRSFVADAYARRLFAFLGCKLPAGYPAFHKALAPVVLATGLSTAQLQEFHGLIDEFGKAYRDDAAKAESFIAGRWQTGRPSPMRTKTGTESPGNRPFLSRANIHE
ncbi:MULTISPECIES: endonuclease III domain-containing protein [Bifidobacterium]|jgi:endonuclease-3 related protein|uniref:DNA lyase n=1 Tax=Bifidobacterium tibiigranuli TaxID=2172043 RepID=A0A5N6SB56_9BIFI|nr:DNA lyase [Bifidobacterium tibiigranuli]KAE8130354.1 DNA lyase [Bifidobacterium tibiigranuli]